MKQPILLLLALILARPAIPAASGQQLTAPDKLLNEIANGRGVNQGCRIAARVTIESLKKIGTGACVVPEPTGTTKLACTVGKALEDELIAEGAINGTTAGCIWTVKKVSAAVVEVTIDFAEKSENAAE